MNCHLKLTDFEVVRAPCTVAAEDVHHNFVLVVVLRRCVSLASHWDLRVALDDNTHHSVGVLNAKTKWSDVP